MPFKAGDSFTFNKIYLFMNFQQQLKYDKLSRLQERLCTNARSKNSVVSNTEASVQGAVNAIITSESHVQEIKEKDPNIVELDGENYGAPPENMGISIHEYWKSKNLPNASSIEPQAWENQYGNWFYNWHGAMRLAQVLGRTLPTISQLFSAIRSQPDSFRKNAGYRNQSIISQFKKHDECSYFWSSSKNAEESAKYAYLDQKTHLPGRFYANYRRWFSIRFIVDKK